MASSAATLLHLVAWAQIGVLLRVYLGALFGTACPALSWAPCMTSGGARWGGALFSDLPANVLGSFLMGLFVSSDVLSNSLKHTLTVEAPMAALPTWSPLQTHTPLQVGLRTGLCGSLTTYASWVVQMVAMCVGGAPLPGLGSQWVEALGGLFVGVLCAMGSLVLGQHVCLLIYHRLNPNAFIPYGSPAPEQLKLESSVHGGSSRGGLNDVASRLSNFQGPGGDASVLSVRALERCSSRVSRTVSTRVEGNTTLVVVEPSAGSGIASTGGSSFGARQPSGRAVSRAALSPPLSSPAGAPHREPLLLHGASPRAGATPFAAAAAAADSGAEQLSVVANGGASFQRLSATSAATLESVTSGGAPVFTEVDAGGAAAGPHASVLAADAFAAVAVAALSGVSLWRVVAGARGGLAGGDSPFARDFWWWAILLGPLGCYGRFYLSRYNGALHGRWKWFPAGTYAANTAACLLDYVLKAALARTALGPTQAAVLNGIVTGVGGCLSTVSTWVVEVQRLLLSFPNSSNGYNYVAISLVSSMLLGLIVYGVPVWTLAA